MAAKIDLTGNKSGKLTALRRDSENALKWVFKCDCGVEKSINSAHFRSGSIKSCGCSTPQKFDDLVGMKFGKLTVVSRAESTNRKIVRWNCLCECGRATISNSGNLKSGMSTSCGCARVKLQNSMAVLNSEVSRYQTGAKRREIDWSLEQEQAESILFGSCAYCGDAPTRLCKVKTQGSAGLALNGIDRVDNNLGYVVGNVVSCCKICNYAKNTLGKDDFLAHVRRIVAFQDAKAQNN